MKYEIRIRQRDKDHDYHEQVEGATETYEEAKELMDIVLRAFPRTQVTISMKEQADNSPKTEKEQEEN